MRELIVSPHFEKDLRRLPRETLDQAERTVARLRQNPLANDLNLQKLRGFTSGVWRARLGSFRLVYSFDEQRLILLRLHHRKDVYRNLENLEKFLKVLEF